MSDISDGRQSLVIERSMRYISIYCNSNGPEAPPRLYFILSALGGLRPSSLFFTSELRKMGIKRMAHLLGCLK